MDKNPVMRGHTKFGDLLIENTHEPIISEDEYLKLIDIIENVLIKLNRNTKLYLEVFWNVRDAKANYTLSRSIKKYDNGKTREVRRYSCDKCHRDNTVKNISFNESEIERQFINTLLKKGTDNFKISVPKKKSYDIDNKVKINEQRANYTRSWSLGYIKDEEYFMLMDETENLLKDIEEKAKSHTDEKLNEEQIRTVKNLLIKGF